MPRQINDRECEGQWVKVIVRNPASVCCDESLMVCALRSVCVSLHPAFGFKILVIERDGKPETVWRWVLAPQSQDGLYHTAQLIKWWRDPHWLKANPRHEFAIVSASLKNMGVQAAEVRRTVSRAVVRRGRNEAHIPTTASPAYRAHLIGQLEGRIPLDEKFQEPVS